MKSFLTDKEIVQFMKKEVAILRGEHVLSKTYEKSESDESIIEIVNRMYNLGKIHGSIEARIELLNKLEKTINDEH